VNRRSLPIVYELLDASLAARALWVPCAAAHCPTIQPGESKRIAKRDIVRAGEPHEVIAYWWHLVRLSDNEFQPDSIRAIRTEY
jgi:hypothetical protein